MPSEAASNFADNYRDILRLWTIRAQVAEYGKDGAERTERLDVLHRAAVVFVAACWESFIEDLALEAFDVLLNHATNPSIIPSRVLVLASKSLIDEKDARAIWRLAGDGWRPVLQEHRTKVRERWIKNFHTPKSEQVKSLFDNLIGLDDVTASWTCRDWPPEQSREVLDSYLSLRGEIAHRTRPSRGIHKKTAKEFASHVNQLVQASDRCVRGHLLSLIGTPPWTEVITTVTGELAQEQS